MTDALLAMLAARTGSLLVALLLASAGAAPASPAQREDPRSGAQLLALCGGFDARPAPGEACLALFREALARHAGRWRGPASVCIPPEFGPAEAVALFRSESRRYPHVLDEPAERLIEGMLLKFFACAGA